MNKNKENSLVSIVIPAFNSARYLNETISSVLNQTYSNFELIIVDDGSTDHTKEIVALYLNDERCHYYYKMNEGVALARNYGAKLAKGEYICFLDADDLFYPENLKEKVEILDSKSDIGLVHSDVQLLNENGNIKGEYIVGLSGKNRHLDILLWKECVIPAPSSNAMLRRNVWEEVSGYDAAFSTAADQDFLIRVCKNHDIYRINKCLVGYRMVPGSMGKNVSVFEKDHISVYSKARKNGLFTDKNFEKECMAKLHLMIASSWWVHHKRIDKTFKHLFLSLKFSHKPIFRKMRKAS